jgi:hypothetical protein
MPRLQIEKMEQREKEPSWVKKILNIQQEKEQTEKSAQSLTDEHERAS